MPTTVQDVSGCHPPMTQLGHQGRQCQGRKAAMLPAGFLCSECHRLSVTFSSLGLKTEVVGNLSSLRLTLTLKSTESCVSSDGSKPSGSGTEGKADHCLQAGGPSCCDGGLWWETQLSPTIQSQMVWAVLFQLSCQSFRQRFSRSIF